MASTTFSGPVTSTNGFIGDLTGNVTGTVVSSRAVLAATGSSAATAAVISTQIVAVTASDGTKAVALPAAATTTAPILVINTVATATATLPVYPIDGGNDNINALSEDAAWTIGPGRAAWFTPTSATQWYVEDVSAATATTTELNYVDVTTAGTAQASKALVLDSSLDITGIHKIGLLSTNPSSAFNLSVFTQNAANTYSGTLTSVLGQITLSGTVDIGNAWAGYFLLTQSAKPTSQGHTSALYVGVTVAVSGNNPTSVMTMELGGADGGTSTPFIMFQNSNSAKTDHVFNFGPDGGTLLGTAATSTTVAFTTGLTAANLNATATCALRVKINGTVYWLPVCTATN